MLGIQVIEMWGGVVGVVVSRVGDPSNVIEKGEGGRVGYDLVKVREGPG